MCIRDSFKDRPKLGRKKRKSVNRDTYLMICDLFNYSLNFVLSVLDETNVVRSFLLITNSFVVEMNKWIWSVASGRHKFSVKDYFYLIITLHCHPTKDRPKWRKKKRKYVNRVTYLMISGLLNSGLKIILSVLDETYVARSFLPITNPLWSNE